MALDARRGNAIARTNASYDESAYVRHPVTPKMWEKAQELSDVEAPDFVANDLLGRTVSLKSLAGGKPLVLYFIRQGCPCSADAEPLIQKLEKRFMGLATFAGIVGGDRKAGLDWRRKYGTPYPLVLDPNFAISRAFKAPRSVYVALVRADGTIERLWPGYGAAMLADLNERLARGTNTPVKPFDTEYAPKERLAAGCLLEEKSKPVTR